MLCPSFSSRLPVLCTSKSCWSKVFCICCSAPTKSGGSPLILPPLSLESVQSRFFSSVTERVPGTWCSTEDSDPLFPAEWSLPCSTSSECCPLSTRSLWTRHCNAEEKKDFFFCLKKKKKKKKNRNKLHY